MAESEFDKAVAESQREAKLLDEELTTDVLGLLVRAGVRKDKAQEIAANPSFVYMIESNPDLVERFAQQFPADYAVSYYEARQGAGLGMQTTVDPALNPEIAAHQRFGQPAVSPTGAVEYEGGVFVQDGQVFFPPNDASLMGSPAWMALVPKWDDTQRQQWIKTLKQNGYIDSLKVDLVTFTDALATYHKNRYLYGGGEPVDLSQGAQGVSKADFGGLLDPAVLDTEVRQWHQELYGANDEPSEEELRRGRERLSKIALRLARKKDLDPTAAASVASARVEARYREAPAQQKWQDLEETDTALHDSFVSLFQALS